MAMTNLNYNHNSQETKKSNPNPPNTAKPDHLNQSPSKHTNTSFAGTNLSNLSPIYEDAVFASPTNTISPSLHSDNNHVVLFNAKISINKEPISPTTASLIINLIIYYQFLAKYCAKF